MTIPLPRKTRRTLLGATCVLSILAAVGGTAMTQFSTAAYADAPAVRKELADVINTAGLMLKQNKFADALAKLKDADGMQKNAYESSIIEQIRLAAAVHLNNAAIATKSLESLGSSLPASAVQQYTLAIAQIYLQDRSFPEALTWVNKYLASGGPDVAHAKQMQLAIYQANGDNANLQKMVLDQIASREKEGAQPAEADLELLEYTSDKLKDTAHFQNASEKLVSFYPTPEHWKVLLHAVTSKPNFARAKYQLDTARLNFMTGNLTKADDYVDYIELALQAGIPGEAKTVLDAGYEKKILGNGADAERHGRLRDLVKKKLDEDQAALAAAEKDAVQDKDGEAVIKVAGDYYGMGKFDKASTLLELGVQKGGGRNLEEARLHLGMAYLAGGQKQKAIDTLKAVKGTDGPSDLAHLWLLKAGARP